MNTLPLTVSVPCHATTPAAAVHFPQRSHLHAAVADEIENGLMVCDEDGMLQFSNRAAQAELGLARQLNTVNGRLRCCRHDATAVNNDAHLATALRLAARKQRRSLLLLQHSSDRLMISVLPLQMADSEQPLVLVMLGRRDLCSDLSLEMLASHYQLTSTERLVLGQLMRGASPKQIAADRSVALSTVRTQIGAIRDKMGTHSVDGLLLLAAELPPVAGALSRHPNSEHLGRAPAVPTFSHASAFSRPARVAALALAA